MTDERISYNDLMERWRTAKTRVRKLEAVVEAARHVRAHHHLFPHEVITALMSTLADLEDG